MGIIIFALLGMALSAGQLELWEVSPVLGDVRLAALSVVLSRAPSRTLAGRTLGLCLGFSVCSLAPIGVFLLAAGSAALLILPLRELLFLQRRTIQALLVLPVIACWAGSHALAAWTQQATFAPLSRTDLYQVLVTMLLAPVVHAMAEGVDRLLRRDVLVVSAYSEVTRNRFFDSTS